MAMFASNALPLPTPFGHEHRPLRLTSEASRPQPNGGCHYRSPSVQSNRCMCQSYQHDRRAPGNVCDCGHSACFHSPTASLEGMPRDRVVTALAEKVKKLEEYIAKERETRKDELARQRQLWENNARESREALSQFYSKEQDMRRKVIDLEDKVDMYYDEHARLGERVSAIDNASMNLERRMQTWDDARGRKRKASLSIEGRGIMSPESSYTVASSVESDTTLSSANMSPQSASPVNPPLQVGVIIPSPRSSGVLNHRATSRQNLRDQADHQRHLQSLSVNGEPRSSGFLSIDLAQRLAKKQPSPARYEERLLPVRALPVGDQKARSLSSSSRLPTPVQSKASSGALSVSGLLSNSPTRRGCDARLPKKRKQQEEMMALDVLANASMASPHAHCS